VYYAIEPRPEASEEEKRLAKEANEALFKLVTSIANDDPWFAIVRFALLGVVSLATVGATVALIIGASSDSTWASIASAGAVVGTLGIVGLMNPLQTIERDIVVRRWSDVIVAGWAASAAGGSTPRSATRLATEEFAALATAYSAMTGQAFDALTALGAQVKADTDTKAAAAKDLAIDPIPDQHTAAGSALSEAVAVKASGGAGKYNFALSGQPKGLEITASDGEITGTVAGDAAVGDQVVTVTVTEVLPEDSTATAASKVAKFVWTVTQ
jgi:hypothetical protein